LRSRLLVLAALECGFTVVFIGLTSLPSAETLPARRNLLIAHAQVAPCTDSTAQMKRSVTVRGECHRFSVLAPKTRICNFACQRAAQLPDPASGARARTRTRLRWCGSQRRSEGAEQQDRALLALLALLAMLALLSLLALLALLALLTPCQLRQLARCCLLAQAWPGNERCAGGGGVSARARQRAMRAGACGAQWTAGRILTERVACCIKEFHSGDYVSASL
jgi:hypothetical protein